jgi:anti-sigma factor RsiW
MHLHGETLERYARRELPADQLAALDEHVSNCMFCAHPLAEARATNPGWERRGWLGRLVRAA